MFYNTMGGHYTHNGAMATYIFPENAYVEINECRIPIGNLKVECFGGPYDEASIQHFTDVISLVQPAKSNINNSSIFINDCDVSIYGYPSKDTFKKYGIEYISHQDFDNLKSHITKEGLPEWHPLCVMHKNLNDFFYRKAYDVRVSIASKIEKILKNNQSFPKSLSIVYDDRWDKHVTHIFLEFYSLKQCVLHIDNVISVSTHFCHDALVQWMKDSKLSWDDIEEKIPETRERERFVDLYKENSNKLLLSLEFSEPVNEQLINRYYSRMILTLKNDLGIPISNVMLHHRSRQNLSQECVPFACENKLNFITHPTDEELVTERVLQRGARIRAQHAVLTYLLKGMDYIPRNSDEKAREFNTVYIKEEWYPNFSDVCFQLNNAIKQMSFSDLSKLYLSIELEGVTKLSDKFKPLILMAMKNKLPLEDYETICFDDEISSSQALIFQNHIAPCVFYNEANRTVQVSKNWAKQMIAQEQNIEDQNMDYLVRKLSYLHVK